MAKNIVIIGGGIVGLCSAYYLHKEGHQVTIIDKGDITSGASFVNAGYVTPGHIMPMASPGMILQGIKMMFNSASPFYMKPSLDMDFLKWVWYFHKSSTKTKVAKAIPVIQKLNQISNELFSEIKQSGDLGEFQLENKGLLMMYKTEAGYLHEKAVADRVRLFGLEVSDLNQSELAQLQPDLQIHAQGAIHYECDSHTTPTEFMPKMLSYLRSQGVVICTNEEVIDIKTDKQHIKTVVTDKNNFTADEVVLAAGSWSGLVSKKLGLALPLQAGKGYRINLERETGISIPAILVEAKMAVTPMNGFTRLAGTMEFSGINEIVRKERVLAIANGAKSFYPRLEISAEEIDNAKVGMRPVSPDGLPYIGKSDTIKNLTIATGHAMMGWSMGPVTGKLVSEIIDNKKTSVGLGAVSPARRFN
jgi:D-amino-acid dehydrogenase